ncbi:hypothetical protein PIB30_084933 [Stylosanthes scabra]|uniref:BED-type domain-containing protein n=1 Tax=Stylosanthes scabra TaxID=79078 RepID=A0ABU6XQU5_9FABA|nr:hypothetical protein [Stylosanthes scabra]
MGRGDCILPQASKENKAMDIEIVATPAPAPALAADAAAPQIVKENRDANINDKEIFRKGKTSYVWSHFIVFPVAENGGKHLAKCHHCPKKYGCHSTKHGTNSMNNHLKGVHLWIFTKGGKKGTFIALCPKLVKKGNL